MIEVYGFLAAFTVQVLAMSVLYPARFSRYVRMQAACLPVESFAKLFPGVDVGVAAERFLKRYRAVNTAIAVLGLLLLGWLINYMRRPDWDASAVIILISAYFGLQLVPQIFVAWIGFRFNRTHKHSLLGGKRKATLQRRGLFDFISPFAVLIAVLAYLLTVVFIVSVQTVPFPGFALIGVLTLTYLSQVVIVYRALYGKKGNPLQTQSSRVHTIGVKVRMAVYGCIACTVFFACIFTVDLMNLLRWVPLAQTVALLVNTLLCLMSLTAPPRRPEADGLGADERLAAGARDLSP